METPFKGGKRSGSLLGFLSSFQLVIYDRRESTS